MREVKPGAADLWVTLLQEFPLLLFGLNISLGMLALSALFESKRDLPPPLRCLESGRYKPDVRNLRDESARRQENVRLVKTSAETESSACASAVRLVYSSAGPTRSGSASS